jgi:transposase-like protein
MKRTQHTREFENQALIKVRERAGKSVRTIAQELHMAEGTLRKWMSKSNQKASLPTPAATLPVDVAAASWSPAQRLLALNETHALSGPELHTWCREKGLFEHQLHAWREAFCTPAAQHTRESSAALRELQNKNDKLQRELNRKEKALAEAAALLVLQKKYQTLWEGEEK